MEPGRFGFVIFVSIIFYTGTGGPSHNTTKFTNSKARSQIASTPGEGVATVHFRSLLPEPAHAPEAVVEPAWVRVGERTPCCFPPSLVSRSEAAAEPAAWGRGGDPQVPRWTPAGGGPGAAAATPRRALRSGEEAAVPGECTGSCGVLPRCLAPS